MAVFICSRLYLWNCQKMSAIPRIEKNEDLKNNKEEFYLNGGRAGTRTPDLLRVKQAL